MKIIILTVIVFNSFISYIFLYTGYQAAFDSLGLWFWAFSVLMIFISLLSLFFWPVLVALTVALGLAFLTSLGKKLIPIFFLSISTPMPCFFLGRYLHLIFKEPSVSCIVFILVSLSYLFLIYTSLIQHLKQYANGL